MSRILLEVKDLKKQFGTTHALKGVSLTLYQGEIVSLLGVNGAGKTTLSSILVSLRPPTSGSILFNGISIYEDLPTYRQQIGFCPQYSNLNPLLTLKDNLYLGGKYYGLSDDQIEKRLHELNQQLGIFEYIERYSNELSGGWKQRFMIARTLLHNPRLVIFDEPTVGLDPDIRYQLWYYIEHIRNQGVTVLLTTHYLDEAEKLSDRVCVLDKGEVRLIDTPDNLKKQFQKGRLEDVFLQLTKQDKE